MSADQQEEPFMPFNLDAAPAVKPTAHKLFLPLPAINPRRSPPAARISLSAAELPTMSLGSHQESIDAAERLISYSKLLISPALLLGFFYQTERSSEQPI